MSLVLWLLVVPAAGAALTATLPARHRLLVAGLTASTTLVLGAFTAGHVLLDGTPVQVRVAPGGSGATLVADGVGVGLVLVTATVAVAATVLVGSRGSTDGADRTTGATTAPVPGRAHWPLSLTLLTGLNGVFLAGDLLTAWLMLEVVAVAAASLVALGGGRARLAAATRYLYAEVVASTTFLLGVALVWRAAGTVILADLGGGTLTDVEGRAGLALMTAGLLLKVPAFPMHFWMPAAHSLAPGAVSPWLSALVVKTAAVVLLRVWAVGPAAPQAVAAEQLIGVVGAAAVLGGGVAALRAREVKRLVAWSTIAQVGLILLAVPLVGAGATEGWVAGSTQAIAHALPKAALLMAVPLVLASTGGTTTRDLVGASTRRPVAVLAIGVSAVSLVGLPPTAGFVAKWYLLVGALDAGQWWWAVVLVAGGVLTAAYLGRVLQRCLQHPPTTPSGATQTRATRTVADVVVLTLALGSVALGLHPEPLVALLQVGAPAAGGAWHG
ncbi:complex I subunit 5 family protein [Cellulomonas bogoriensis]|uniref:Fomrate hydrogenlyase subunit 3/multisubunit Na+/H+ antiporter subunit MnhD n=1 Tax=Cellulomonas bogoriensis 69B4 = DSM 16987 TaxID=1386082 RepID=A0A0A0BXS2_9CELL|nr:proton-conducting transporter membrane subunit [Cellulomonas bogoriensis]KGM12701.1 fomrate hydrogenlyase subunit 3/multisubunit Na+/H+ antiporter subunit MnhD [Cellulomonas bogoriensis 69B4 = DSM 16987]